MARSFSNLKLVSESISVALSRRGYAAAAAASQGAATGVKRGGGGGMSNVMLKKGGGGGGGGEESSKTPTTTSWVPDPATGYYRPENKAAKEIDPADLRNMLLNHD